jgi:hypothetical protein
MRLASLAVPGCDFRRSAFGLTLAALLASLTSLARLRCLRRLTGSSERPLSVPPCGWLSRAFVRGGSSGVLVAPNLPARAPWWLRHAPCGRGLRRVALARFLFPEPAGRPTALWPGARGRATRGPRDLGKGRATAPVTRSIPWRTRRASGLDPAPTTQAPQRPKGARSAASRGRSRARGLRRCLRRRRLRERARGLRRCLRRRRLRGRARGLRRCLRRRRLRGRARGLRVRAGPLI